MNQITICEAIQARRVLQFSYSNQARSVEPHILGHDREGDLILNGWQQSGSRPDRRNFHVAKKSGLTTTESTFQGARPGYRRDDDTFHRVLCQL